MNLKNSLLLALLFLCFISCDKKRVFDEYKSVGNSWHKDSIVTFELPELDKDKTYDLFLNVRDNDDYPFNNLFVIVSLEQPDKKIKVDTLEYVMTNPDGTLLGEGFSDIKESKLFYKGNEKFDQKGVYKVHIKQAVRQTGKIEGVENLKGITDIGFRIESKE
ncbi:gliding motility lipoprotein GldH [Flavobacterium capsici]|uniref:Gliding motility lipoprotein GldH n=1 Tax=Flavobacterium capsici TaxID=3075618 RepID=A0AA96EZ45_9FLAO|nr:MULTISPECIES: gliding motility lipoprotein GldH [unclassified Flavobacterium]WNM19740.1 gliding motility lipoprotein GldH [Flavobacterium sp. PMR2A8]WNM21129.1 gliding motility lipoprotein GldH [Flavobacterium sp. PMTSA4]